TWALRERGKVISARSSRTCSTSPTVPIVGFAAPTGRNRPWPGMTKAHSRYSPTSPAPAAKSAASTSSVDSWGMCTTRTSRGPRSVLLMSSPAFREVELVVGHDDRLSPLEYPRGDAPEDGEGRMRAPHDRARSDDRVVADVRAAGDDALRRDPDVVPDAHRGLDDPLVLDRGLEVVDAVVEVADVDVVGEDARLADLDVEPGVDGVADADDRLGADAQRPLVRAK